MAKLYIELNIEERLELRSTLWKARLSSGWLGSTQAWLETQPFASMTQLTNVY